MDRTRRLAEHIDAFTAFARRRLGDPQLAADAVQDAFVRAVRHAGSLRDDERAVAWFYRILRHAIADLRHARRPVADPARAIGLPAPASDHREACACLGRIIADLPPGHAEVVRRVDLDGGDPAVVAAAMGLSPGNLAVRRHRARSALRQRLLEVCRSCAAEGCADCSCPP